MALTQWDCENGYVVVALCYELREMSARKCSRGLDPDCSVRYDNHGCGVGVCISGGARKDMEHQK